MNYERYAIRAGRLADLLNYPSRHVKIEGQDAYFLPLTDFNDMKSDLDIMGAPAISEKLKIWCRPWSYLNRDGYLLSIVALRDIRKDIVSLSNQFSSIVDAEDRKKR